MLLLYIGVGFQGEKIYNKLGTLLTVQKLLLKAFTFSQRDCHKLLNKFYCMSKILFSYISDLIFMFQN